jgi:hypothetical protein
MALTVQFLSITLLHCYAIWCSGTDFNPLYEIDGGPQYLLHQFIYIYIWENHWRDSHEIDFGRIVIFIKFGQKVTEVLYESIVTWMVTALLGNWSLNISQPNTRKTTIGRRRRFICGRRRDRCYAKSRWTLHYNNMGCFLCGRCRGYIAPVTNITE